MSFYLRITLHPSDRYHAPKPDPKPEPEDDRFEYVLIPWSRILTPEPPHECALPWRSGGYGSTGQPDGTVTVCPVCDTAWFSGPCYESYGPVTKWFKVRWYHRKHRRIANDLRKETSR